MHLVFLGKNGLGMKSNSITSRQLYVVILFETVSYVLSLKCLELLVHFQFFPLTSQQFAFPIIATIFAYIIHFYSKKLSWLVSNTLSYAVCITLLMCVSKDQILNEPHILGAICITMITAYGIDRRFLTKSTNG